MKVIWTERAKETFYQNMSYLEEEWTESVIENFIEKTDESILVISSHPLLFPLVSKKKRVHKCLVVKQVSLFYRIIGDEIYLVTFWNNFQNPKKLKL